MFCNIHWYNSPPNLWQERYENVKNTNLLQSQVYSNAQAHLNKQKLRFGIIEIDGKDAGMLYIQEAGIAWNLLHAAILDRGPLWFDGHGGQKEQEAFFKAFRKAFPRRIGRKIRFIPEISDTSENKTMLENAGFRHVSGSSYQTRCLDLDKSLDELRADFKKRWRNALSKAERQNLSIEWDDQGAQLNWLLKAYTLNKATKGYDGPSVKLIYELAKHAIPRKEVLIGRALKENKPIGAVLLLTHGAGATYQIGWNSNDGRDAGAHYILLWDALNCLKSRGVRHLDLGGTNDDTAKGVKAFKDGMGGMSVTLPGMYT